MKKLYALLIILIIIYVGINVSVNGFNILNDSNSTPPTGNTKTVVGNVSFPELANFTKTKINDTDIKYVDNDTGVNIEVQKIDNSENVSNTYKKLSESGTYTSSQSIDQNGVTAYFLYNEGQSGYDTEILFNKNNQNFKITGHNTTYENSDYFIKSCKQIIDSIGKDSN